MYPLSKVKLHLLPVIGASFCDTNDLGGSPCPQVIGSLFFPGHQIWKWGTSRLVSLPILLVHFAPTFPRSHVKCHCLPDTADPGLLLGSSLPATSLLPGLPSSQNTPAPFIVFTCFTSGFPHRLSHEGTDRISMRPNTVPVWEIFADQISEWMYFEAHMKAVSVPFIYMSLVTHDHDFQEVSLPYEITELQPRVPREYE